MTITEKDAAQLKRITEGLVSNLQKIIGPDAEKRFRQKASAGDIAKLMSRKMKLHFTAHSPNPRTRAKANMDMNKAAFGPLKRAFGEDTLLRALPEEAASEHVANLCEELGAPDIATLCRKKIAQLQPRKAIQATAPNRPRI